MSGSSNPSQAQSASLNNSFGAANTSMLEDESIYVLPKTYNGKTVTELFPEFQYDSVNDYYKIN